MREVAPGVWHWEAPHPDWEPGEPWPREVSSYAMEVGGRLLVFDPIAPPDEILERAEERGAAIVLTAPWHERDTRRLVQRFGWPVFAPPPDTQQDLMRKYNARAEQTAGGSPDLRWLLAGEGEWHPYAAGERLPVGVEAFPGREHNDLVLWVGERRVVVAGDTLVDFGRGFEIAEWLREAVTREQVAEGLRPLLELPVEHVLAAHGGPTDGAALARALS